MIGLFKFRSVGSGTEGLCVSVMTDREESEHIVVKTALALESGGCELKSQHCCLLACDLGKVNFPKPQGLQVIMEIQ